MCTRKIQTDGIVQIRSNSTYVIIEIQTIAKNGYSNEMFNPKIMERPNTRLNRKLRKETLSMSKF